jgi:hypothetical protein
MIPGEQHDIPGRNRHSCLAEQSWIKVEAGTSRHRLALPALALYFRGALISAAPWCSIRWVTTPLSSLKNSISASTTLRKNFVSDSANNGALSLSFANNQTASKGFVCQHMCGPTN